MKFLRNFMDKLAPTFEEGGKLSKFYPIYELIDTILYTTADVTKNASHIRDGLDMKRMMTIVIIGLQPALLMAAYNSGLQANLAIDAIGQNPEGWRAGFLVWIGLGFDPSSLLDNFFHGFMYFLPVIVVTMTVGGFWEVVFAIVKKHEINEGFLVTGMIFPLILPPTIPLWQVAVGISFGVVIGKEIFGGTGMNIFNPALISRAFLFFNFPAAMSGTEVWTAVDGFSGATPLGIIADTGLASLTDVTWLDAFYGFIPGSMGETSTLAILLGAGILVFTRIGSWQIMLSIFVTAGATALFLNQFPSDTNAMMTLPPEWHFVLGGLAFGAVFMATDPVSAAMTDKGKWIYGILIGFMVIMIRVINPAFPEGMMLAILFGNAFAPVIDNFIVRANIKRRKARYGTA
ncbi:MAG: NADH:ubiquinone reductase (Na(+)-transporting) subunit B [Leptospirales bacterium]